MITDRRALRFAYVMEVDIHTEGKGFGGGLWLVYIYFYTHNNGGIFFPPEGFHWGEGVDLLLSGY